MFIELIVSLFVGLNLIIRSGFNVPDQDIQSFSLVFIQLNIIIQAVLVLLDFIEVFNKLRYYLMQFLSHFWNLAIVGIQLQELVFLQNLLQGFQLIRFLPQVHTAFMHFI